MVSTGGWSWIMMELFWNDTLRAERRVLDIKIWTNMVSRSHVRESMATLDLDSFSLFDNAESDHLHNSHGHAITFKPSPNFRWYFIYLLNTETTSQLTFFLHLPHGKSPSVGFTPFLDLLFKPFLACVSHWFQEFCAFHFQCLFCR